MDIVDLMMYLFSIVMLYYNLLLASFQDFLKKLLSVRTAIFSCPFLILLVTERLINQFSVARFFITKFFN